MKQPNTPNTIEHPKSRVWTVVIVLIFLSMISVITALIIGIFISTSDIEESGNVAHITITGTILPENSDGLLSSGSTSSQDIVKFITRAEENPDVKAILLEINSPGGTPVASAEIAQAVAKSNKTTVAWVREVGASGAYWVASSADHIVAHPVSMVGSVGVIASYIEFEGTLHRYNATYRRLVSGKYKDIGTPLKEMTTEEEDIMQSMISDIKDEFYGDVVKRRNLSEENAAAIADAQIFTGRKALKFGLVDELGGKAEAIKWIEKKEGITAELAKYEKPKTLADILTEVFSSASFKVGEGMGSALLKEEVSTGVDVRT